MICCKGNEGNSKKKKISNYGLACVIHKKHWKNIQKKKKCITLFIIGEEVLRT